MTKSQEKNAIEQRIDYLAGLWNEFAQNPKPRILRWLTNADESSLVELFIDIQSEEIGDLPDLFIRFDDPFEDFSTYGFRLINSLKAKYQEIRDGLKEAGIASDWICPQPQPGEFDKVAIMRVCNSFHEYYKDLMEYLVLHLAPAKIYDLEAWQQWLLLVVRSGLLQNIRLSVIDNIESQDLNPVCKTEPELILTVEPKLEMPEALEDLAEQPDGVGPGYVFRRHFVALNNAAAKSDLDKVNKEAEAALKIATKQDWHQMQVVIYMAVGSTYLNHKDVEKAIKNYRHAIECGKKAQEQNEPAALKLIVQAKFAEAAALVSDGQFAEAAKVYEEIVPLTLEQKDHMMTVEAWRMAAYCFEAIKNKPESWRCGNKALEAGSFLDDEMRKNSTLPYIGQGMLRQLPKDRAYQHLEMQVRQKMVALIGPDWEKKIEEMEGA